MKTISTFWWKPVVAKRKKSRVSSRAKMVQNCLFRSQSVSLRPYAIGKRVTVLNLEKMSNILVVLIPLTPGVHKNATYA